jgi:uncharacterized protein YecE (DUF72 family)
VFDTVEINNTFYRLPETQTFKAWRKQAPDGFIYAVKASRFLTSSAVAARAGCSVEVVREKERASVS